MQTTSVPSLRNYVTRVRAQINACHYLLQYTTVLCEVLHNRLLLILVLVIIIALTGTVRHIRVINGIIFWLLRLA